MSKIDKFFTKLALKKVNLLTNKELVTFMKNEIHDKKIDIDYRWEVIREVNAKQKHKEKARIKHYYSQIELWESWIKNSQWENIKNLVFSKNRYTYIEKYKDVYYKHQRNLKGEDYWEINKDFIKFPRKIRDNNNYLYLIRKMERKFHIDYILKISDTYLIYKHNERHFKVKLNPEIKNLNNKVYLGLYRDLVSHKKTN